MHRSKSRQLPTLTVSLTLVAMICATGSLFAQGFVPKHELVERARADARRDWQRGRVRGKLQADGAERGVRLASHGRSMTQPTGSGVARAAYDPDMPPYHREPEMYYDPPAMDGVVIHEGDGSEGCVDGCGGCGPARGFCGPAGCDHGCGCARPACIALCLPACRTFDAFWGVHGFTGPVNEGGTGSFGFHEGFNIGTQLPHLFCGQWGAQVGVRGVHSNFSGSNVSTESRNQLFLTTGIFRRADCGLQGGVVLDYLEEDWHVDSQLLQLRGEASWVMRCRAELGVLFRSGVEDDAAMANNELMMAEVTDAYAVFYRHRFLPCGDGEARIYAGFSGESDGLLGGDFRLPLTHTLSVEGGWTYLIPDEATNQGGALNESWNVFLGMSWKPGSLHRGARHFYRPLFRVADNGSFMRDFN